MTTPINENSISPIVNLYEKRDAIIKDLYENLPLGKSIKISNTNLEIKIPKTYIFREEKIASNNIVGHVDFYVKEDPLINTYPEIGMIPNFYIGTIKTTLTPKQWVASNVSYQGEKWNENMGTGKEITINNLKVFSVQVLCCGGYNQMYIYPYQSLNGEKILVVIGTYDVYGNIDYNTENWTKEINSDRNVILDSILSTLQKKQ